MLYYNIKTVVILSLAVSETVHSFSKPYSVWHLSALTLYLQGVNGRHPM